MLTGVYLLNSFEFLNEDIAEGISLSYHDYLKEYSLSEGDDTGDADIWETDFLIGFKKTRDKINAWFWYNTKDEGYGFEPDTDAEYSAIVDTEAAVMQVVNSKYGILGAMASPCYPNQVDGDSEGNIRAYAPHPGLIGSMNNELKSRIFEIGGECKWH